jgi:hypothetical protein
MAYCKIFTTAIYGIGTILELSPQPAVTIDLRFDVMVGVAQD